MCRPVLSGTVEMIKLRFDVIGVEGLMEREEEGMMLCRVPEEGTVRGPCRRRLREERIVFIELEGRRGRE